jgi:hypothetical protein
MKVHLALFAGFRFFFAPMDTPLKERTQRVPAHLKQTTPI